jgi:aromatic ring-opening dioxygenase catalytic subunit (LigB family)
VLLPAYNVGMERRLPTLFIPHGGGPCFFMDPPAGLPRDLWATMERYLRSVAAKVGAKPRAALVISGHWEEPVPTVQSATSHTLLFDYYGFPEHTYQLTYPAPGSPPVAARVRALLASAGIDSGEERERGLDHGVFIPFKLVYPDADVPIVQLSLQQGLDPTAHLAIGRALAPLREEGVLIVGSGMSYHNLRRFFVDAAAVNSTATAFDDWLGVAVTASPAERERLLRQWRSAPGAHECHPTPEHLVPLLVVAGAAGADEGLVDYRAPLLGKPISGFRFGAHAAP